MTNYDVLDTAEVKYLTYLIGQLKDIESQYFEYFNDRDKKLELVLGGKLSKLKDKIDIELKQIKDKINSLAIYFPLDHNFLNSIGNDLEKINNYLISNEIITQYLKS